MLVLKSSLSHCVRTKLYPQRDYNHYLALHAVCKNMAKQVVFKDHEKNVKKRKMVDVDAIYGHCLITTLAWSLWEESQSETIKTKSQKARKAGYLQASSDFFITFYKL